MATITQDISSLGSIPTTADPATFDTRADAFLGTALPLLRTEINTWAGQANVVAGYINGKAVDAAASETAAAQSVIDAAAEVAEASGYAGDALSSANLAAGSANLQGAWASQTGAAAPPYSVTHDGRLWVLLNSLADVTASEPGVTADWQAIGTLSIIERSTNTVLAADDLGANIKYTGAGGFTQTFEPVASLVDGWFVYLKNTTTGNITLNPDGAETIDGLASFIMYPGEYRLVQLNATGTALESTVLNSFEVTFDNSGTFTTPPGYVAFGGEAWSAGAGGARDASAARGGCGGGCFPFVIQSAEWGATETITIGAGGAGRTTNGTPNPGGATSVGSLIVVAGATAGNGGGVAPDGTNAVLSSGVAAGFDGAANGAISVYGGSASPSSANAASGNSIYGGAAGGSHDGTLRAAGTSTFGGNGGAAGDATDGTDGAVPGGGGGATRTGTTSGAGGDGRVVIRGVL